MMTAAEKSELSYRQHRWRLAANEANEHPDCAQRRRQAQIREQDVFDFIQLLMGVGA